MREGSTAADAGFRRGDRVLKVGPYPIRTRSRYRGAVGSFPAETVVPVAIRRGGKELTLKVTLDRVAGGGDGRAGGGWIGVVAADAEGGGAQIEEVRPDSPAAKAKLRVGDVILKVGSRSVDDTQGLFRQVKRYRPGQTVTLRIRRGDEELDVKIKLAKKPDKKPDK